MNHARARLCQMMSTYSLLPQQVLCLPYGTSNKTRDAFPLRNNNVSNRKPKSYFVFPPLWRKEEKGSTWVFRLFSKRYFVAGKCPRLLLLSCPLACVLTRQWTVKPARWRQITRACRSLSAAVVIFLHGRHLHSYWGAAKGSLPPLARVKTCTWVCRRENEKKIGDLSLSLSRQQYSFRWFNSFPFLFRRPQRSAGRSSRAGTGRTTALEKQWYRERENTHPPIPTTLILPSPFFRSSSARGIV